MVGLSRPMETRTAPAPRPVGRTAIQTQRPIERPLPQVQVPFSIGETSADTAAPAPAPLVLVAPAWPQLSVDIPRYGTALEQVLEPAVRGIQQHGHLPIALGTQFTYVQHVCGGY